MRFSLYKTIGIVIYFIIAVITIIILAISPNIANVIKLLVILLLFSGMLYIVIVLLKVSLFSLFQDNSKEYKKKDDKHMMKNGFTDMFDSTPKKKD